jgi:rhodanese-related sulfurtransferase
VSEREFATKEVPVMLWVSQLHWPDPLAVPDTTPGPEDWLPQDAPPNWPAEAVRIDVRSYGEFMAGHLQGAHSLPLPRLLELMPMLRMAPDTPLLVYCATGARSEQAVAALRRQGWQQVYHGGGALELASRLHEPLLRGM